MSLKPCARPSSENPVLPSLTSSTTFLLLLDEELLLLEK